MNYIKAVGGTKSLRALSESVAWWCIDELGLSRMRTLEIEIQLNKCLNEGAYGFCYEGENDRDFTIEIEKRLPIMPKKVHGCKNGREAFIETLCHEMVHVWQNARGTMRDTFGDGTAKGYRKYWKGVDHTDTAYSKQPWERQAYRMQGKMLQDYLRFEKEKG